MANLQYAPDGTAHESLEAYTAYYQAHQAELDAIVAAANPLSDVEIAAQALAARRRTREDVIFSDTSGLVGTCYAWLQRECEVAGEEDPQSKSPSQALQAGQALCSVYGNQLRRWIDFAAPDFYTSMSAPVEAMPWLEWEPAGVGKSIREAILDRIYLATYGVARPA